MSRDSFWERWSRRKLDARQDVEPAPPAERQVPPAVNAQSEPMVGQQTAEAKPELPPLDSVGLDTGVAAFFRSGVDEGLRRLALKKLFSDPHFNTMDGLDVYIDDYSKPNPIPPHILERLVRAQTWLRGDAEDADKGEIAPQSDAPVTDTEDPSQREEPGVDKGFQKV